MKVATSVLLLLTGAPACIMQVGSSTSHVAKGPNVSGGEAAQPRACDEDLLVAYWNALKGKGIRTAELEGTRFQNSGGVAEGGTDALEFAEEVTLVQEAVRLGLRRRAPLVNVCQTGFNAGVSALAFLCGTPPSVRVHSFDIGEHDYVAKAEGLLATEYGYAARHRLVLGSSLQSLPNEQRRGTLRCDFVFVDGGHGFDAVSSDIQTFGRMSRRGVRVVVENCNVFGRHAHGGWGGQPAVNLAYFWGLQTGNVTHVKQISTGACHVAGQAHTCRELCVGEFT